MAKFIFTGDPGASAKDKAKTPEIAYTDPVTRKKIKFDLNGAAVEVPDWLAARLKNSTHFKAADKSEK
jgi:hypothetical protein